MAGPSEYIEQIKELYNGLTLQQKIIAGVITGVVLTGFAALVMFNNSVPMSILYSDLDQNDASEVVGWLKKEGVKYEIVQGGSSSIWGSNASAGVINIITKQPQKGVHGSLALSYGSYNTKGADADISYADEKLSAQILASYLETDGFSSFVPRDAEADGYKNNSYNVKLGYIFNENNKISLQYNDIKTDMKYDGYDSFYQPLPDDPDTYGDTRQKNYGLNYTFSMDNYKAFLRINRNDITRNYISNVPFNESTSLNEATSDEYSLINQYTYGSKNKAVLGLEYKDIDGLSKYDSAFYKDLRETGYKNKAVYISNLYYINDTTLLETNLRYDDFDAFDNATTYKIGLKHDHTFIEGFTTAVNYYTAYDAPSTYQLVYAIPSLKPMSTKGFDVSASYKDLISISYFNNRVEDAIEDVGGWGNPSYVNVDGTEKFEGLELAGMYVFDDLNLHLSANYTHLFKYEKDDGTDLIRRPKDILNANIDYYTENDMHFGTQAQYIGDRTDDDFSTFPATKVQTGNYTLWNLYFDTELAKDLKLNVTARNIFDKEYEEVYGYATEGRSIYAKVKYSF